MFSSSPNVRLTLLRIENRPDTLGGRTFHLHGSKEVIGILFSVTSKEHYESLKQDHRIDLACSIQSFLYDGSRYAEVNGTIYRIERTFLQGQFMELYLIETAIKGSEMDGYPG